MPKIRVFVELSDKRYRAYEDEGRRRGATVESLVQQTVQGLMRELEEDEERGTDHEIIVP